MGLTHLKSRQMRQKLLTSAFFVFLVMSFQNCAPPGVNRTPASTQNKTAANTTPAATISTTGSSSGSTSTGQTSAFTAAGTSNSGSYGGASGTYAGSSSNTTSQLRIVTQPTSVTVLEGANYSLGVVVAGGHSPYKYRWSLNGLALSQMFGDSSIYSDTADRYNKAGKYTVTITDAAGASLTSSVANVGINEISGSCQAGNYSMMSTNNDPTGTQLYQLFENVRGLYLINNSHPEISWMMSYPSYWGITNYNFAAGAALEKRNVSCSTYIPRINDPRTYTNTTYSGFYGQSQWVSSGAITFECRNQKWKLVSNSCQWSKKTQCTSILGTLTNCN